MPTSKAMTAPKRGPGRTIEFVNDFVDHGMRRLSPPEIVVWVVLLRNTKWINEKTWRAEASVSYIAKQSDMGRRTVLRALKELKEKRFVKELKKGGKDMGASIYQIVPDGPDPSPDTIAAKPIGEIHINAIPNP